MFGISPLGWIHTLGSLPAIPLALYMLARHGRIVPRSGPGLAYLLSMLVGATTVFLVTRQAAGVVIASVTLLFLLIGYGVGRLTRLGRAALYVETISLSLSVFLLMVPAVSETLRRVPDGHPFVTDVKSPLLVGAQGGLFVLLVIGVIVQLVALRRQGRAVVVLAA